MKNLLFALLILSTTAAAQSKNELLKTIDENIQQLEAFIKFSNMSIELSSGDNKEFDAADGFNFEEGVRLETVPDSVLQKFFDNLKATSAIYYPYSFFSVGNNENALQKLLGKDGFYFMKNANMSPVLRPLKLYYTDGTYLDIKDDYITPQKIEEKYKRMEKDGKQEYEVIDTTAASSIEKFVYNSKSGFNHIWAVHAHKPVKQITVAYNLPVVGSQTVYASKAHDSVVTDFGSIKIVAIQGNKVVFQLPTVLEKSLLVRGLYKDGRILRQKSSNSNTVITQEKKQGLVEMIKVLKAARELVEQNKIKTNAELEKHLQSRTPESIANADDHNDLEPEKHYTQKSITFSGPIARLAFVMSSKDTVNKTFVQTYTLHRDKKEEDYEVALRFEDEKTGILSKSGKWLVQPRFDTYFRMMNRYYFTDQIDHRENIYHFDPKTNTIEEVNYRLDDYEIFLDKYVKVEPNVNGLIGVADATTGKIVLPMEHRYIHLKENKFWVGENNKGKDGAYDTHFNVVLPFEFTSVKYENGFFYTKKDGEWRKNVYDSKGKSLVGEKYYDIEYDYNDGRLLVKSGNQVRPGYYENSRYYFLDETGKEVIDLKAQGFSGAMIFRDSLAAVKDAKTDLYGFMDTKGKLVLPCVYKYVSFGFFKESHYAPVKLPDGDYALIDKNGKVKMRFKNSFDVVQYNGDEKGRYLLTDGMWYNAFGQGVKN